MTIVILGAWVLIHASTNAVPVYFNTQAHCEEARKMKLYGQSNWACVATGFPEVKP